MTGDPQELRQRAVEHWDAASTGWERRHDAVRTFSAPVMSWLIDALNPQPGQCVLELAAGIGETGFMAAELILPGGTLITTDQSPGMLAAARRRAQELGLSNVQFKVMDAEWIDLPVASVDGVICRWGYMLMLDPLAALVETRRVLRPGGRLALAVWDSVERNPWAQIPGRLLVERGLTEPPAPGSPGPFALGDGEQLRGLLEEAGFAEVHVDRVEVAQRHDSFDSFWESTLDLSGNFHDAIMSRPEDEIADLRDELRRRLGPFTGPDGKLEIPGRTLVAAADA